MRTFIRHGDNSDPLTEASHNAAQFTMHIYNLVTRIQLMVDQRGVGDRLFGRAARLIVADWVCHAEEDLFYQSEAVKGTGVPQSNVREELARLVELGMLSELPREPGERRKHYLRQPSPLWEVIRNTRQAITQLSGSRAPASGIGRG